MTSSTDFTHLPKAVLHDHLDGGLRVDTILELADECGYGGLPASDAVSLANWFDQGRSGSLERYLEAFVHTVAVMQTDFEKSTWRAFWLTAVELLRPQAVAEERDISVAAVYKAKSRVLRRLREELDELDLID